MILYFFICLFATTIGAISGIGGGIIIKPVMDAVSAMSVSAVSFLSGCTVLSMSIVSLLCNRDSAKVEMRQGTLLAIGAVVGGFAGKAVFDILKTLDMGDYFVGIIQNMMMVLLTFGVMIYMFCRSYIQTIHVSNMAACICIGLGLGMLSTFLGIGGGPVNLIVLYYFFSMNTKTAAINSLYIILFSQSASLASTLLQQRIPEFPTIVMIVMVAGGVLGGLSGRALSHRMTTKQMDTIFYILLIVIIGISFHNAARFASQSSFYLNVL